MERLQKVISQAGITSRRKAEQLILSGKVRVNGLVIQELGTKVNPEFDHITVNGEKIKLNQKKIVLLFNKPIKVITSLKDPQGRKKIIDYVAIKERVFPVGRLDYDTEGLILLTNDGELANRLMHPRYELDKTYEVVIDGRPKEIELDKLRKGILLDEGWTSPAEIQIIETMKSNAKLLVTIHEGKNRQVRRMFEYINYKVTKLKRIRYGFLSLHGVSTGNYRLLSGDEVNKLRKMVGLV